MRPGPGKGPEAATEVSVSSFQPDCGWQCGLWRAPLGVGPGMGHPGQESPGATKQQPVFQAIQISAKSEWSAGVGKEAGVARVPTKN